MKRAKGHEDFLIFRNAGMRSEDDRASISEMKQIAIRVPYEFVRKTEREDVGALSMRERGVKGSGDIQTVHVENRRGKGGIAGIAILKGVDPARVASENVVRGVGRETSTGEKTIFTRNAGGWLD